MVGGVVVIDVNTYFSSVWARLTDERVVRDIMRFVCGVCLTNHSREARFEGPKL